MIALKGWWWCWLLGPILQNFLIGFNAKIKYYYLFYMAFEIKMHHSDKFCTTGAKSFIILIPDFWSWEKFGWKMINCYSMQITRRVIWNWSNLLSWLLILYCEGMILRFGARNSFKEDFKVAVHFYGFSVDRVTVSQSGSPQAAKSRRSDWSYTCLAYLSRMT